jgi:hypothetical protein
LLAEEVISDEGYLLYIFPGRTYSTLKENIWIEPGNVTKHEIRLIHLLPYVLLDNTCRGYPIHPIDARLLQEGKAGGNA